MRNPIPIYATQSDLIVLINEVAVARPLDFFAAGTFDERPKLQTVPVHCLEPFKQYLGADPGSTLNYRMVASGQRFVVDQSENPNSALLNCGGFVNDKERLVLGDISTASEDEFPRELLKFFYKAVRRRFAKVRSVYVGPEAFSLMKTGTRLAPTSMSPPLYDLALESQEER